MAPIRPRGVAIVNPGRRKSSGPGARLRKTRRRSALRRRRSRPKSGARLRSAVSFGDLMSSKNAALFAPLAVGDLVLPNRVVMAPLTRLRATLPGHVPSALMTEYYAQRASAGLIISEATPVSTWGVGYEGVPGIWSSQQTQGWKEVTRAVHDQGGRIMLQLWHVGRISDPYFLNGEPPVAPSAIAPKGHVSLLRPQKPYGVPRALERHEIPGVVEDFRRGALNALEAGFDGVEIHGANGYLLDQFLQDSSNRRWRQRRPKPLRRSGRPARHGQHDDQAENRGEHAIFHERDAGLASNEATHKH